MDDLYFLGYAMTKSGAADVQHLRGLFFHNELSHVTNKRSNEYLHSKRASYHAFKEQ